MLKSGNNSDLAGDLASLRDREYMAHALELAQAAYERGEVPIGAIIVTASGDIIGTGSNRVEECQCQDAHAEMEALRQASAHRSDWRLDGSSLYVTVEPCIMCFGAAALSRVERIVYGAPSPRFGSVELLGDLFVARMRNVYLDAIRSVVPHVLREKAQELIQKFFIEQRLNKKT